MADQDIALMAIILSDSVIREMGTGKISYIGAFHQYQSPNFPLAVPQFVVTSLLTNIHGKLAKPLSVAVRIEDQRTGALFANIVGQVGLQPEYVFTGSEVVDLPFPVGPLVFQSSGLYTINVLVDGDKIGSRSLPVNSITQPPSQQ